MASLDALTRVLRAIIADNGEDGPQRICHAVVDALPVDGAAITLMSDPDHQERVCATNDVATRLDELQFSLAEGPCIDAYTSGQPVMVADITEPTEQRWPLFVAELHPLRVRSVHALPLQAGMVKLGVFDLYGNQRGLLAGDDLTGALRAADAAMWTVLDVRISSTLDNAESLDGAAGPLHWAEVHQATGIIIAQLNVPAAEALARLRAYAFAHDRPLSEVAREVIARKLKLDGGEH